MGSLGPPARAMAVRSAFALFCFALLCGLAASSIQSETETDLTKEGEATGDEVLVEQAVESRAARGADKKTINKLREKCRKNRKGKACKRLTEKRKDRKNSRNAKKSKRQKPKRKGQKKKGRSGEKGKKNKGKKGKNKNKNKNKSKNRANKQAQRKKLKQLKMARRERTKAGNAKSNATVALTCLKTALQLLKFQKDNVNNFLARHVRQQRQNALSTKKKGKKGEYAEPAARLIQSGGGNKSNLTCGGSTTSEGAKQLLNLTDLLSGCSEKIHEACTPPSGINQTFMSECYDKSKGYNTTLSECVTKGLSGEDPCSCFMEPKLVGAMTNLRPCKGKDEAKLAAKQRTKCLNQMRACNGYVEKAGRLQYTCKYTTDDLKKTLAQITANNATVAAAMAKVKALTGVEASDSSSNSSRRAREAEEMPISEEDIPAAMDAVQQLMQTSGRHLGKRDIRVKRATFTCANITTAVETCTTAVSSTPSGSTIVQSCTIETTQTSITCTEAEKTALQTTTNTLFVAQRIFTAFAVSILNELSESAGATPSTAELEVLVNEITTGTSTKAASSRNRNMLRQMVLDKMRN